MLESSLAALFVFAIATCANAASIGTKHGNQPTLLDTVHGIVNEIIAQASTTPRPVPGKMNVCENLCPKWCQKIEGIDRNFTNCHYMCGNLCSIKTRQTNPFIGNLKFEVVPSEYDFARYDLNQDKHISIREFAHVEGIPVDEAVAFFNFSDFNNDGFIDSDEFQGGPLVFTVQMASELSSITMSK
ncbi:uncharacterized protein LOC132714679 [Ruditapes philippinarum]|uniref:uncharacterized protein LOC132714679 n=1 Tax=Ruditapes philippinarum TaxID=129788 RepID=UPI00295B2332|nr:uncharacterized protein LOC132714679 [Ruditapes philippinarum]